MASLPELLTVIGLMLVVLSFAALARRLPIPSPILLVIAGLVIGLIPGHPIVRLQPDVVFLLFLPPILYAAAYFTSLREFRANLRPITLLAVGLVILTAFAVAVVARVVFPGLGWATGLALGAIVSPPDAVAAVAVVGRLPVPRRTITILEGESLVNDATALILYRAAIAAAVTGQFSLSASLLEFVVAAVGGVALGLASAWLIHKAICLGEDPFAQTALTFVAPYVAWVLGEMTHTSAVLACVAGGLYGRQHFNAVVAPATRLQARAVWELLIFLLNGFIFLLIGLQVGAIREQVSGAAMQIGLLGGLAVSLVAIVVRLAYVPIAGALSRWLFATFRKREPAPSWKSLLILGWTSMRGVVSLASALALPLVIADGSPFPFRNEIILVTFVVILVTLVVQGLTLAPLIRWLKFPEQTGNEEETAAARQAAVRSALTRLESLAEAEWLKDHPAVAERLRLVYDQRLKRFSDVSGLEPGLSQAATAALRRLRWELLTSERQALQRMRREGQLGDDTLLALERDLDVEAMRLGLGELRAVG